MTTYYKVLDKRGHPFHGGNGQWHLPRGQKPGKWMLPIKDPILCRRGYHLLRNESDLAQWLGPTIWLAEARGQLLADTDKVVVEQARLLSKVETWNERTARLFGADCAEHVLHLYERDYPTDLRPCQAIEATKAFANGQIDAAAWDAARAAARDAAWDAARAAAGDAAWDAARAAARDAAGDAARAAARDAARDAAGDAARAAAWAAAGAAAWAAAWDAAWAAERQWQAERLGQYLRGEVKT